MSQPVRLQLSRKAGFSLQRESQERNGLPAVNVARPGPWGNPYVVDRLVPDGALWAVRRGGEVQHRAMTKTGAASHAVACFEADLQTAQALQPVAAAVALRPLRGKNLACWCAADQPCHADVLLRLANMTAEPVR